MNGYRTLRAAAVLGLATVLGGCGITHWFSGGPVEKTPPPLAKGEAKLSFGQQWQARLYGDWRLTPYQRTEIAVTGDRYLVGDSHGRLMAISASGRQLWVRDLDGRISRGPSIGDGVVYVGTDAGKIYAFTLNDGKRLWEVQLSSEVLTSVVMAEGHLVAQTVDGRLWALDPKNGQVQWTFSLTEPSLMLRGTATPLVHGGVVYAGFANGELAAVKLDSGAELWKATVAVPHGNNELARIVDVDASPYWWQGRVIAGAYQGNLASFDARSGTQDWSRAMSIYHAPVLFGDRLYAVDADGMIYAMEPGTGAVLWRNVSLKGHDITGLSVCDGHILAADTGGYLYAIDPKSGHRVAQERLSMTGIQGAPECLPDNRLLVLSGEGTLYKLILEPR